MEPGAFKVTIDKQTGADGSFELIIFPTGVVDDSGYFLSDNMGVLIGRQGGFSGYSPYKLTSDINMSGIINSSDVSFLGFIGDPIHPAYTDIKLAELTLIARSPLIDEGGDNFATSSRIAEIEFQVNTPMKIYVDLNNDGDFLDLHSSVAPGLNSRIEFPLKSGTNVFRILLKDNFGQLIEKIITIIGQ